jgi:hypothetical protein
MPDTNGLWYRLWHLDETLSSLAALSPDRRKEVRADRIKEIYGSTNSFWYQYWHPGHVASSFTYLTRHSEMTSTDSGFYRIWHPTSIESSRLAQKGRDAISEGEQQEGRQSEHRTFSAGGRAAETSRGPIVPKGQK